MCFIYSGEKQVSLQIHLTLLKWRKWWAPSNASRWQMRFNLVSKGLIVSKFKGSTYEGIFTFKIPSFHSLNFRLWSSLLRYHGFRSLSPIAFKDCHHMYALKIGEYSVYQSSLCQNFPNKLIYIICKFRRTHLPSI